MEPTGGPVVGQRIRIYIVTTNDGTDTRWGTIMRGAYIDHERAEEEAITWRLRKQEWAMPGFPAPHVDVHQLLLHGALPVPPRRRRA